MIRLSEQEFAEIVKYMSESFGIDLKKKKVLIECRMARTMKERGIRSFSKYMDLVKRDSNGREAAALVDCLTTNYTYFLREPAHFTLLKEKILPDIFERVRLDICNIWCAGCSTGEECYTLAMAIADFLGKRETRLPGINIKATDISKAALEKAESGIYSERELEKLPKQWKEKYCQAAGPNQYRIDNSLRRWIRFRNENLMQPAGRERFDLIFCRNVMIYFDREAKDRLIRRFEDSLNPGGYLILGHAELLSRTDTILEPVYPAVYQKI